MSSNSFAAGLRLYLAGEQDAAVTALLQHEGEKEGCRAACQALTLWCSEGASASEELIRHLGRAVELGYIDLNYMPFLGLAAASCSRNRVYSPLRRIAFTRLAIDALRLAGELSGAVKRSIENVTGDALAYRLAVAEHELPRLQRKYPQDYRQYEALEVKHLDLTRGRAETSLAIAVSLLPQAGTARSAANGQF